MPSSMKIALVTLDDPTSPRAWSGVPFGMMSGFVAGGATVIPIGPLKVPVSPVLKGIARVRNSLAADRYEFSREPLVLRSYARQVASAVHDSQSDLIVAPGSVPVSMLDSDRPLVIWADATVGGMIGYYDDFSTWSRRTRRVAFDAERSALARADLFIAASDWAAESALREYQLPPERVAVVPFGANTPPIPRVARRSPGQQDVRLLSVGVDWYRKGIDTAVLAVEDLRRSGIRAHLDVVGCEVPRAQKLPEFVRVTGFLSRTTEDGRRRLDEMYRSADVFILPTRADCFGVVFCEAAAYGLPVIAAGTGGVATAVLDGVTGLLAPAGAGPESYAELVRELMSKPCLYEQLARQARERYELVLNWEQATGNLLAVVKERLSLRT